MLAIFWIHKDLYFLSLGLLDFAEAIFEDAGEGISWFFALTFFAFLLSPLYGFFAKTLFGSRGVLVDYLGCLRTNFIQLEHWSASGTMISELMTANRTWRCWKARVLNGLSHRLFDVFLSLLVVSFHRHNHLDNIFVHLVYGLIKGCTLLLERGTPLLLFFLFAINCRPIGGVMQNTIFFTFRSPLLNDLIIFLQLLINLFGCGNLLF